MKYAVLRLFVLALVAGSMAWAQNSPASSKPPGTRTRTNATSARGTLVGTIHSRRGPFPGAIVRVTNSANGAARETRTAADGTYRMQLPPGTYGVFATPVGYIPFSKHGVVLTANAEVRVDATLGDNPNEGTPGEIAYLHLRDEHTPPKGPAPRTRDGRPDLSGVWYPSQDLEPEEVPFLPWAAEFNRTTPVADDPRAHCLPSGTARGQQNDLSKFIQLPDQFVMLVEGAPPGFRQIFLGRPGHPAQHPKEMLPSWMGHSIAHWEGDVLVVDTIGFHNRGWIDFNRTPQTEQLHITERFHRLDLGHMDLMITIDDPGAYSRPWNIHRILTLAEGEEIQEYVCNENNHTEHLQR